MNALLSKLDEALNDMEHGWESNETELWAEIDALKVGGHIAEEK